MRPVTDAPRRLRGKETLPPKRRRKYRETHDVVAGLGRIIESVGKRIAVEDPEDLAHLIALNEAVVAAWSTAVAGIRETGFTDRQIGQALGISRQAVEQRWPRVTESLERALTISLRQPEGGDPG